MIRHTIMMGFGTKILAAYHHPNFKNGLLVAILDSKEKLVKHKRLSTGELKKYASKVCSEMFFAEIDDLDRYIENLEEIRNRWRGEVE